MKIEKLSVLGTKEPTCRNNNCNPSRQSACLQFGNEKRVMVVRPLNQEFSGFPPEREFKRRKEAIRWHKSNLPDCTQETQILLLQGQINGQKKTVFARLVPELQHVRPITELKKRDFLSSPALTDKISRINWAHFKAFISKGVCFDSGGRLKRKTFSLRSFFSNAMLSNNIMVGNNGRGEATVFCDPDWFLKTKDRLDPSDLSKTSRELREHFISGFTFLARACYFRALNLYQKLPVPGIKARQSLTIDQ